MQVTVNLPDKLTEKISDKWSDLPETLLNYLVLKAFQEGLINFEEFREMLSYQDEADYRAFLSANIPLHASGLLNLAGSCADIDFAIDNLGISDQMDDEMIGVFDE